MAFPPVQDPPPKHWWRVRSIHYLIASIIFIVATLYALANLSGSVFGSARAHRVHVTELLFVIAAVYGTFAVFRAKVVFARISQKSNSDDR